ncbi:MAG: hypothetical protein Q8R00_00305 [Candidatus Nanoarchaeia archaeon]|nr:hypothetical protein [Candidatus Nanoarchaeia archaeon]
MTLENKIKGAFKERVYNRVDSSTGIRYAVRKPSLAKKLFSGISTTILGGFLGLMPGCNGGGGSSGGSANKAPVITSTPITSINQGSNYVYDVDATDADGDPITYSFAPPPAPQPPVGISIANPSGIINWFNVGPAGTYIFRIQAKDNKGGIDTQDVSLNVASITPVVINTKNIDGNGLSSLEVHLFNSTYPKGTYKINSTSGAVSNTLSVPAGTYTLEIADAAFPFSTIFTYQQPGIVIPNQTTNFNLNNPEMILMHTFASSNVNYRNSQNQTSWLQFLKYETGTTAANNPSGGPHILRKWPSKTFNIFYDATNATATDNELADGSAGSNGTPDGVDRARRGASLYVTALTGISFNEVPSNPTQGIRFQWMTSPSTPSLTITDGYNSDGTYQHATLQIDNNLSNNSYLIMTQALGRALWKPDQTTVSTNYPNAVAPSPDSQYLLATSTTASGPTTDEQRIFKYVSSLLAGGLGQSTAGANMDFYKDQ